MISVMWSNPRVHTHAVFHNPQGSVVTTNSAPWLRVVTFQGQAAIPKSSVVSHRTLLCEEPRHFTAQWRSLGLCNTSSLLWWLSAGTRLKLLEQYLEHSQPASVFTKHCHCFLTPSPQTPMTIKYAPSRWGCSAVIFRSINLNLDEITTNGINKQALQYCLLNLYLYIIQR